MSPLKLSVFGYILVYRQLIGHWVIIDLWGTYWYLDTYCISLQTLAELQANYWSSDDSLFKKLLVFGHLLAFKWSIGLKTLVDLWTKLWHEENIDSYNALKLLMTSSYTFILYVTLFQDLSLIIGKLFLLWVIISIYCITCYIIKKEILLKYIAYLHYWYNIKLV